MMSTFRFFLVIILVAGVERVNSTSLKDSFKHLSEKYDTIRNDNMNSLIIRNVPYGTPKPQPALAEYFTFKERDSAKIITGPNGQKIFREFRRLSIADVLNRPHSGIPG